MKRFLTTTTTLACLAGAAFADQTATNSNEAQTSSSEQSAMSNGSNDTSSANGDAVFNVSAASLIKKSLYVLPNADGIPEDEMLTTLMNGYTDAPDDWTMVGDINDVLIDPDGAIQHVVVDAGGFLGMNEKRILVSKDNVWFPPKRGTEDGFFVVFNGSPDTFAEQDQVNPEETSWDNMFSFLDSDTTEANRARGAVPLSGLMMEEITGLPVYSSDDEWVGEVSTYTLSEGGTLDQAILDIGGFLGLGERQIAVDWDRMSFLEVQDDELRARVSKSSEELQNTEAWTQ